MLRCLVGIPIIIKISFLKLFFFVERKIKFRADKRNYYLFSSYRRNFAFIELRCLAFVVSNFSVVICYLLFVICYCLFVCLFFLLNDVVQLNFKIERRTTCVAFEMCCIVARRRLVRWIFVVVELITKSFLFIVSFSTLWTMKKKTTKKTQSHSSTIQFEEVDEHAVVDKSADSACVERCVADCQEKKCCEVELMHWNKNLEGTTTDSNHQKVLIQ